MNSEIPFGAPRVGAERHVALRAWRTVKYAGVGALMGVVASCGGGPVAEQPQVHAQPIAEVEGSFQLPIDCDIDRPLPPTQDLGGLRKDVAAMEPSITYQQYAQLKERIASDDTKEEVIAALDSHFKTIGSSVSYGEVRVAETPDPAPAAESADAVLADVTLADLKKSTTAMLQDMSKYPRSFFNNTPLYLDDYIGDMTSNTGTTEEQHEEIGGTATTINGPNAPIPIRLKISTGMGLVLGHELQHTREARECRPTPTDEDRLFVSVSGKGFSYPGYNDSKQRFTLQDEGRIITSYAGSSYHEDRAESGASLMSRGFADENRASPNSPIVNKKKEIVAMRNAATDPRILSLYRYLTYNEHAFPWDIAKSNSVFYECFGYENNDAPRPQPERVISKTGQVFNYNKTVYPDESGGTAEVSYFYGAAGAFKDSQDLTDELVEALEHSGEVIKPSNIQLADYSRGDKTPYSTHCGRLVVT